MGELLRRRAMMAQASGGGGDEPLYHFHDFKRYYTGYIGSVSCSGGNHFTCIPSRGNKYYFDFNTAGQSASSNPPSPVETMFKLKAGDYVECRAKNIVYSSSHDNDQLLFMFRDSADTFLAGFGSSGGLIFPSNGTTLSDKVVTKTMSADCDITYIRVNRQGSGNYDLTVEFDFEVYVNGVRYI